MFSKIVEVLLVVKVKTKNAAPSNKHESIGDFSIPSEEQRSGMPKSKVGSSVLGGDCIGAVLESVRLILRNYCISTLSWGERYCSFESVQVEETSVLRTSKLINSFRNHGLRAQRTCLLLVAFCSFEFGYGYSTCSRQ